MKIKITHKVVDRMITRSKRNFLKSNQPEAAKSLIKDLEPCVLFNSKFRRTFAMAYAVPYQSDFRKRIGLTRCDPRYKIDGKRQHLVIEIGTNCQSLPPFLVFDTVSHELAHCLDFRLRGYEMNHRKRKGYHDNFWANLHLSMGGTGNEFHYFSEEECIYE